MYLQAGRSYPGIDEGDRLNCARVWLNHPLPYTGVVELPLRYTPPSPETLNQVAGYVRSRIYIFNGFLFVGR